MGSEAASAFLKYNIGIAGGGVHGDQEKHSSDQQLT